MQLHGRNTGRLRLSCMKTKRKTVNILVALNLSGSTGRRVLAGILNERELSRAANIRIMHDPHDLLKTPLDDGSVDGIIAYVDAEMAARLESSKVPLVALDFVPSVLYRRKDNISVIVEDNEGIGQLGAKHLMSLGKLASIGFVPDMRNRGWSRIREHAFARCTRDAGKKTRIYQADKEPLGKWLKDLPKPAAVMAAFDFRAKEVLDACTENAIKVPEQIAVLGVDNDRLLCENASTPLSSIDYDQEAFGSLAIRTIVKMVRSRKPWGRRKLMIEMNERVVERSSTKPTALSAHLAGRALDFIDRHYGEDISGDDVAKSLGVSRRLVELRLSEAGQPTLRMAIEARRMKELERLLRKTKMSISKATTLAGFTNVQRAKYVFKSRYGMSMREWRS